MEIKSLLHTLHNGLLNGSINQSSTVSCISRIMSGISDPQLCLPPKTLSCTMLLSTWKNNWPNWQVSSHNVTTALPIQANSAPLFGGRTHVCSLIHSRVIKLSNRWILELFMAKNGRMELAEQDFDNIFELELGPRWEVVMWRLGGAREGGELGSNQANQNARTMCMGDKICWIQGTPEKEWQWDNCCLEVGLGQDHSCL